MTANPNACTRAAEDAARAERAPAEWIVPVRVVVDREIRVLARSAEHARRRAESWSNVVGTSDDLDQTDWTVTGEPRRA